jgi:hypothetical protein
MNNMNNINNMNINCKSCFSYKRPGVDFGCCAKNACNSLQLQSNVCGATEKTHIQKIEQEVLRCSSDVVRNVVLAENIQNQNMISQRLEGELLTYGANRFNKYYRQPPMFIPESVLRLARETANVGVPKTVVEPCSGR